MIICKRPVHRDDHLHEAGLSGGSFTRGRSIRMTICKRPVDQDDHLQEAGRSGWSFSRGQSIWMIICKRPVHQDDHLQEAGPSGWSFALVFGRCLSLVIVCQWSLFVVGRCLSLVIVSCWLLFVAGRCLALVVVKENIFQPQIFLFTTNALFCNHCGYFLFPDLLFRQITTIWTQYLLLLLLFAQHVSTLWPWSRAG